MTNSESVFPEEVARRLRYVRDAEAGGFYELVSTSALVADVEAWLSRECSHQRISPRRKLTKAGGYTFRRYCDDCGLAEGMPLKKSLFANPDTLPVLEKDYHAYWRSRENELAEIKSTHLAIQLRQGNRSYDEYLLTPKWRAKRRKVMERAGGICEGCREVKAAQVHHLTYEHRFNEFLFELVAVCVPCHERLHTYGDVPQSEEQ